jgi:L-asparaginase
MTRSISVLGLGGTIAMTPSEQGGVVPTLTGEQLAAGLPELASVGAVTARTVFSKPGVHLTFEDIAVLAAIVAAERQAGRAVVITQGTDTIEETAFALDCLLPPGPAVVVTGAMRHPTSPGADGPANLLAAARVAASGDADGLGVLVVMNDTIHAARFVRKAHTSNPAAFVSANAGPLGWLREEQVRIVLRPAPQPQIAAVAVHDARVGVVQFGLGDDGGLIQATVQYGYDGLVLAATGAGHLSAEAAETAAAASRAIPVVLASRTGAGEIFENTYGFAGAEIDLIGKGLIPAGALDAAKARILLVLLLRAGADRAAIRAAFARA